MPTGPICHLCRSVVPTVRWVTLDEVTTGEAETVAATGTEDTDGPERTDTTETDQSGPSPPGGNREPQEVGLCPDCLAAARARGRLLAPIIPLRPGARRRRRSSE